MFDKELFYSLCKKYDVELSDRYDRPMIKDGDEIRAIMDEDVEHVFSNREAQFDCFAEKIVVI